MQPQSNISTIFNGPKTPNSKLKSGSPPTDASNICNINQIIAL